jgi:hypothetical protein
MNYTEVVYLIWGVEIGLVLGHAFTLMGLSRAKRSGTLAVLEQNMKKQLKSARLVGVYHYEI